MNGFVIAYSQAETLFGRLTVASTDKGIGDGALGGYRWGGARKAAMLGRALAAHDVAQGHGVDV